jgi:ElaA protein
MLKTYPIVVKKFDVLDINELYAIMALRLAVFCVEQDCPYQDLDGQDQSATHIFIQDQKKVVAYARIIQKNRSCSLIGRVVVSSKYRKLGLANKIMLHCIDEIKQTKTEKIELSAQSYLHKFYANLGFKSTGEYYLEDDIPHEHMQMIIK